MPPFASSTIRFPPSCHGKLGSACESSQRFLSNFSHNGHYDEALNFCDSFRSSDRVSRNPRCSCRSGRGPPIPRTLFISGRAADLGSESNRSKAIRLRFRVDQPPAAAVVMGILCTDPLCGTANGAMLYVTRTFRGGRSAHGRSRVSGCYLWVGGGCGFVRRFGAACRRSTAWAVRFDDRRSSVGRCGPRAPLRVAGAGSGGIDIEHGVFTGPHDTHTHSGNDPGRGRPARVSPKTVSRVINNEPRVRADTRKRVLAAIERTQLPARSQCPGSGQQPLIPHRAVLRQTGDYPSEFQAGAVGDAGNRTCT